MAYTKQKEEFDSFGYTIVKAFIPEDTAKVLKDISVSDKAISDNCRSVLDSDGRTSKVTLWYAPGEDVFGRLSCSDLMSDIVTYLLDGKASFFHAKLMNKEPRIGGKWEWHQDYGYWYNMGFLKSDMISCFVALDQCNKENGALTVIPKSHLYGRLDHGEIGQQAGADRLKVEAIEARHGTVVCEMEPGDALFFHSNTLHSSGPNLSEHSRLGLISSFFRQDNESIINDPRYLNKEIRKCAHSRILDGSHQLDLSVGFLERDAHISSKLPKS